MPEQEPNPPQEPVLPPADALTEETSPMLDVHPAHHAASTWREFFIHIATIVIGLFIAVSLEQSVELLHHRHQRNKLEEELRGDGTSNVPIIKEDTTHAQNIIDWAMGQAAAIEHAGPTGPVLLSRMPAGAIDRPDAGVWLAAKANGQAILLPAGEQNWFEDLDLLQSQLFVSNASSAAQLNAAYATLNHALVGRATETPSGELDLSTLNATERADVVAHLRAIAEQARNVMRGLISYTDDIEYILSTPDDQVDQDQTMANFYAIAGKNAAAHPGLNYSFSAK